MKRLILVSLLFSSVAFASPNSLYEHFETPTPQMSVIPKKVSFKPLPIEIYYGTTNKPAVVFTTPCLMLAKVFPPAKISETIIFNVSDTLNKAGFLPISLEPVCI